MRTKDDVEQYLIDMDTPFEIVKEGVYHLMDDVPDVDDIIVVVTPPLVIFSLRLMKVPSKNREAFYAKLLDLNANALVAGAYGLDGDYVVISDTLQLENLDFNEFEASISSLAMAIHEHLPILREYVDDDSADKADAADAEKADAAKA